jgi:hypothetical protein
MRRMILLLALCVLAFPTTAPADELSEQFDTCKRGLSAADPVMMAAVDMSCMDAATKYAQRAHQAAIAGHTYDRDRYRLLAGTSYVAAGNIETRIGDDSDAHDDFRQGIALLRLASTSHYTAIAQSAVGVLRIAENH